MQECRDGFDDLIGGRTRESDVDEAEEVTIFAGDVEVEGVDCAAGLVKDDLGRVPDDVDVEEGVLLSGSFFGAAAVGAFAADLVELVGCTPAGLAT